jgi:Reverse transcriptase (RNA-dependent DNA polymerase)
MDVDTAFLNADISENIWVQVPKGTPVPDGDDGVYKLWKPLYGLKQAPREWNHMANVFLINKGFERMEADPCIYKKTERVKVDGKDQIKHSIIALYVDDSLVACSTTRMCKDLETLFQSEFQMNIMGEVRYIPRYGG